MVLRFSMLGLMLAGSDMPETGFLMVGRASIVAVDAEGEVGEIAGW